LAALLAGGAGEEVEEFGGGEADPDEAVNDDERAQNAPDGEARPVEWRGFSGFASDSTRGPVGPALPEAVEALGDFSGGEKNHQPHAQDARPDEILNERIAHVAENINWNVQVGNESSASVILFFFAVRLPG
jgi:hypothetical protein